MAQIAAKKKEIEDELTEAQKTCEHVDDGGMIEGHCTKCLIGFG